MDEPDPDRPTTLLPLSQLVRLSVYWLGLVAVVQGIGIVLQERITVLVPDTSIQYTTLGALQVAGIIIAVLVQPTVGTLSDYTVSRFGRRKPYIVFGALFDVVFLVGIATANSLVAIAAFVTLLALSTNIARGPFQGYVPDLVPEQQVGLASAMVGMFQVLGNVIGFGLAAIATSSGNVGMAIIAIAVIELITMLSVVLRVPKGPPAKPRNGRSWLSIAAETWGTDILQEKSYIWMLASRLFILMGGAAVLNFVVFYLADALGLNEQQSGTAFLQMLAAATILSLIAIVPASRLSDRIGRKPVIYACTALGALGLGIIALAPDVNVATIGAAIFGASQGTFLAVDWALMTDIIPKAASGRYMGLSNVVTASSTTIAVAIGGVTIDLLNKSLGVGVGNRIELGFGMVYFLLGALALRPVVEPDRRGTRAAPAAAVTPGAPGTP